MGDWQPGAKNKSSTMADTKKIAKDFPSGFTPLWIQREILCRTSIMIITLTVKKTVNKLAKPITRSVDDFAGKGVHLSVGLICRIG